MIIYRGYWFRQIAWIVFCIIGITVTLSLVSIFPFNFSVIPNASAVDVVPTGVTVFLVLWAVMYGIAAIVQTVKLVREFRSHTVE